MGSQRSRQPLSTISTIFLIGYRGTGKSTVGEWLARRLRWEFADTDRRVEKRTGKSIARIFAEEGEEVFRAHESAVLEEVCAQASTGASMVVATGGGIILRERNRELLRSAGAVVWLAAAPDVLRARIEDDPASAASRPSLSGTGSSADEVERILKVREPLYRAAAHQVVEVVGKDPHQLVDEILKEIDARPVGAP